MIAVGDQTAIPGIARPGSTDHASQVVNRDKAPAIIPTARYSTIPVCAYGAGPAWAVARVDGRTD
jgi:hypothetical protein